MAKEHNHEATFVVGRTCWCRLFLISSLANHATEPTPTPEKQITNSIGMKLTLVPSGEFMMGSKESAEETTALFHKNHRIF